MMLLGLGVIALFIGSKIFLSVYPDYLWFKDVGFLTAFWTPLLAKTAFFILFAFVSFIFIISNFMIARGIITHFDSRGNVLENLLNRLLNQNRYGYSYNPLAEAIKQFIIKYTNLALGIIAIAISLLVGGVQGMVGWDVILAYFNQAASTVADPIFHRSLSFYFFSLPFYAQLSSFSLVILVITFGILMFLYFQLGLLNVSLSVFKDRRIKTHLLILGSLFFLLVAVKFWLARYGMLLTSSTRLFHGPGYTDIHAGLFNYFLLAAMSLLTAVILLLDIFLPNIRPIFLFISALILCGFFFGGIVPTLMQRFIVNPNEYLKEKPYIQHNIDYTLKAYDLREVKESFFPAANELNSQLLKTNKEIVDNIRVWDETPMLKTLAQLQEIRLYYEFPSVDVDRYQLNGKEQQVMIAARELIGSQLSQKAQNWVNRKLQYTHGYGVVMSPVNRFTEDGMPEFFLKDIPPLASAGITLNRSEIYFGERTEDYVIANTSLKEFDYPQGDDNQFTQYRGKTGIPMDNFLNRLLYTVYWGDTNILLTSYIKPGSKLLYNRSILSRVKTIAPFLQYDNDPYIVVADGRLFWMIDAYTVTDQYPYSQPFNRSFNYIRNPVKVVVDAYDGSVKFYQMQTDDPLIRTYAKIYPGLFTPFEQMPAQLKGHIRTPRDYFAIQAHMFRIYHMTNPQVFYNQEDVWEIPRQKSEDNDQRMDPYYITMKLPGENKFEFLNMIPYVPANKNNLVSWLVAKNSPGEYGKKAVYKLTKDRQIYGPMQIESRIDQDTQISQMLTLWGQKGSTVIRGNLLIIPIENSLLYVEPLYLQSTSSNLPQLKRVIVAYGDNVVMEDDLAKAILKVFGAAPVAPEQPETIALSPQSSAQSLPSPEHKELAKQALRYYEEAQEQLRRGNWSAYGESLDKLSGVLRKMTK